MSDINQSAIGGRLTRDPVVRGGGNVALLSLASNRQFQKDGEWVEEVTFIDVVCFGYLAKKAIDRLLKGAPVMVAGRLELNQWQNDEGEKRSQVRIIANQLDSPAFRGRKNPNATEELPTSANVETTDGEGKNLDGELVAAATDDDIPF